jgi:hypothetical protein
VKEGIQLNQIGLLTAINNEICRQVPGIAVEPRLFNSVIAAANSIVAEFAKPIVKATPAMGLEAWLDSDDTGSSSLYMAWCLSSGQFGYWQGRNQPKPAYPHDPDDLGRCIRLVRAVPELAERVQVMSEHGKEWAAVAENWDRWVELYDGEYGLTLYDEMKAAYGEE